MTPQERAVIQNRAFFDLKKSATDKIIKELQELRQAIKASTQFQQFDFPERTDTANGKISKGENYLGYPYLILDFPRRFEKGNIFAIRSMFWWGYGCIFTIHLSGDAFLVFKNKLLQSYHILKKSTFQVATSTDQWQHHPTSDTFRSIADFSYEEWAEFLESCSFFKMVETLPLKEIDLLTTKGLAFVQNLLVLLKS